MRASRRWTWGRMKTPAAIRAMRQRLHLRVTEPCYRDTVRCACALPLFLVPDSHDNSCPKCAGSRLTVHNHFRDKCMQMAHEAKLAATREPHADEPGPGGADIRGDLEVFTGGDRSRFVDFCVTDPRVGTALLSGTYKKVGGAIDTQTTTKEQTYQGRLAISRCCHPAVVECTGRFSKGVVDLVERCALAAARTGLTTRGRFKLKWLTILSVTLHSLNYNATRRNLRRACEFSNVKMREMEEQAAMGAGEAPIMAQGGGVGEGMGGQ